MILFLLACSAQADELALEEPTEIIETNNTDIPQHPEDRSKEQIMIDMLSIELFLTDKKNFKLYCGDMEWEQPSIKIYKKQLVSQLPAKCQARVPAPEPTEEEK
tara:strand:+ start:781 stop:1092 length:312 start_codon:yes stop_codon:yes gene_type:complete